MAQLEDLEKRLYGKETDAELEKRTLEHVILDKPPEHIPPFWKEKESSDASLEHRNLIRKKIITIIGAAGLVLLIGGGAVFAFFYLGIRGQEASVAIDDIGGVDAGGVVHIPVHIKNISRTTLKDVELTLIFPHNALLIESGVETPAPPRLTRKLEDVPSGQDQIQEFDVRFFGKEGDVESVQASLRYRPENFQAIFLVKAERSVSIGNVPIHVFVESPETLSDGQDTDIVVRYTSDSEKEFNGLALRVQYPPGFTFVSADVAPSRDTNIWNVDALSSGETHAIHIHGKIKGQEGEIKAFQAGLGMLNIVTNDWQAYAETTREIKMAVNPLSVQGTLADSRDATITPGDNLSFLVKYKNNTAFTIKNATVRAFVEDGYSLSEGAVHSSGDPNILLFETVASTDGGVFDQTSHAEVWSSGRVPALRELKPGDEGTLRFSILTRTSPVVHSELEKNLSVRLSSQIDASDFPHEFLGTKIGSSDRIDFKVKSKVLFVGKSLYRSAQMVNSGPVPPKAGKKTTYTIVWEIKNFSNDLHGAEVKASIPPNVTWEGSTAPSGVHIDFDQSSGTAIWSIGDVPAGTGVVSPTLVGSFKVGVVPSTSDIGKPVTLAGSSKLTAQDGFTNESIEQNVDALSTEVREDTTVMGQDWAVVR